MRKSAVEMYLVIRAMWTRISFVLDSL